MDVLDHLVLADARTTAFARTGACGRLERERPGAHVWRRRRAWRGSARRPGPGFARAGWPALPYEVESSRHQPAEGGPGGSPRFTTHALLPHDADLLRQCGPAPRPRLHDRAGRRRGARPPAAGRGRPVPDGHRRARAEDRAVGPQGRAWTPRTFVDGVAAGFQDAVRRPARLATTTSSAPPRRATARPSRRSGARVGRTGRPLQGQVRGLVLHHRRALRAGDAVGGRQALSRPAAASVEWLEEENYKFRLSKYQQPLRRALPTPARTSSCRRRATTRCWPSSSAASTT